MSNCDITFNYAEYIPEKIRNLLDTVDTSYLDIEDLMLLRKHDLVCYLEEQGLIDTREAKFLQDELLELGWNLNIKLTDYQKRKLLFFVPTINKQRGHPDSIIFTVWLLWGIRLKYSIINYRTSGYWVMVDPKGQISMEKDDDEDFIDGGPIDILMEDGTTRESYIRERVPTDRTRNTYWTKYKIPPGTTLNPGDLFADDQGRSKIGINCKVGSRARFSSYRILLALDQDEVIIENKQITSIENGILTINSDDFIYNTNDKIELFGNTSTYSYILNEGSGNQIEIEDTSLFSVGDFITIKRLSDRQKEDIKKVVEYLRAATIKYLFEWEIEDINILDLFWNIGISKMGISTKIYGS